MLNLKRFPVTIGGVLSLNGSATTTRIRCMLVRDTRPNNSLPAVSDVLSSINVNAFMNIDDQIKRFRVLHDKVIVLDSNNHREYVVKVYKKLNHHLKLNDTQTPVLNDIFWLMVSDEATNTPSVSIQSRIRYYDN